VEDEGYILHCQILNIGTDSEAHRLLQELVQSEPLIRLQHIEMGSIALEHLRNLSEPELPHIVLVPFRLPIVTSLEFTSAMHSHERLQSVPILVWGVEITAGQMSDLYRAGATSVLLGEFGENHLEAVRRFVLGIDTLIPATTPITSLPANESPSPKPGKQCHRDVQLGTLFVRTGCLCAALWLCAVIRFGSSYRLIDIAPVAVYGALACAGFSLMSTRSVPERR
jgi:DNA-binding NarL/FixJ family response regulator